MCGFAGFQAHPDRPLPGEPDRLLAGMGHVLRHRGPDAGGSSWDHPCGFVHRRLSVIDLSDAGNQPMSNEDGSVSLVFNGEIYNFRELRERFALDRKGHVFRSRSDTEVLVHLYEEMGTGMLEHLDGMYAIAIHDRRADVLHLVRDPFGIKPLFYMETGGHLWFASEIKALLQVPGFERRPSLPALQHFLSLDYVPSSLTAFEGIHELRPGHVLSARPGRGADLRSFLAVEFGPERDLGMNEAVEECRVRLEAAVKRQLVSDVPVGVMLSGGLDSSAITRVVTRRGSARPLHSFSLAFDEPSFDESAHALAVAEHCGTRHHTVRVTPDAVRDLLPHYLAHIDEPYGDGSAIPTWLLAREAARHVTVLLSGEGGDELFAGYDTHAAFRARAAYRRIPAVVRRWLVRPAVDRLPVSHTKLSLDFRAKRFVRGAELDVPESHFAWRAVASEDEKRALLSGYQEDLGPTDRLFREAYDAAGTRDPLHRLLFVDWSYHFPDDLMIKNDRMTMAHGIEARVPFTDVALVAAVNSMPSRLKMRGLGGKALLREALKGELPAPVVKRKKVGLEMPYSEWLCGPLRDVAEDCLAEPKIRSIGLLDSAIVQRYWREHVARRADHGRLLWGLVNYVVWHDLYIATTDYLRYVQPPRAPRQATLEAPLREEG